MILIIIISNQRDIVKSTLSECITKKEKNKKNKKKKEKESI